MSEEIKAPQQTEVKVDLGKIAARAEELKKLVGKSFQKKGGGNGIIKVMEYGGVRLRQVSKDSIEQAHTLVVESYGARWLIKAKELQDDYEEVKTEEKPVATEIL